MYSFIVNPNARTGLGFQIWEDLEKVLKEKKVDYEVHFTKRTRHATKIAEELTSAPGEHTLIVLGGDGTINEVVNGIADLKHTTLGYIPIGSSNDFARAMHLSTDPVQALNNILSPQKYTDVNIGLLNYSDKTKRFAVSAGLGFDAGVTHQVMVSKLKLFLNKLKLGKLSYAVVALQRIISMTPRKMTLILDDKKRLEFDKVYFAAAMNQRYEGGGFAFCPAADPSDDILDIILVSDISKLKILFLLPTAFKGWHVHFKGVRTFRCKKAELISETPLPVHTDGEPVFLKRTISASLEPDKLHIITS